MTAALARPGAAPRRPAPRGFAARSTPFAAVPVLLPSRGPGPASALAAFCRLADDETDLGSAPQRAMAGLHRRLDHIYAGRPQPIDADHALAAVVHRYGLRNVTLSSLLVVASGLVASLFMTQIWQLVLLWGVVIGLGTGMTALVLGATIAARWFSARRGLVVGILTASVATGQLVFLPLLASLTESLGWRTALVLICGMLGVAATAVLLVMRDRPSDLGLRPFGDEGTEPLPAPPPNTAPIVAGALGALRDAATGGNTFFVLETIRELLSTDQLTADAEVPLSPTVRETVLRRTGRFSPLARQVLEVTAVL